VPESLLTDKSEFFKAACRNEWKEATSRVIKLPDVDNDVFRSYLFWIYREKVAIRNGVYLEVKDDDVGLAELAQRCCAIHTSLAQLWILADRLADVRLRNAVIDEMAPGLSKEYGTPPAPEKDALQYFPPALTTLVWSNTTADRPLRRLALDYYNDCVWAREVKHRLDEFQPVFLGDFMVAAMLKAEKSEVYHSSPQEKIEEHGRCYYHEHDEQCPPCPKMQGEEQSCSEEEVSDTE
jgi:hypothetical protein